MAGPGRAARTGIVKAEGYGRRDGSAPGGRAGRNDPRGMIGEIPQASVPTGREGSTFTNDPPPREGLKALAVQSGDVPPAGPARRFGDPSALFAVGAPLVAAAAPLADLFPSGFGEVAQVCGLMGAGAMVAMGFGGFLRSVGDFFHRLAGSQDADPPEPAAPPQASEAPSIAENGAPSGNEPAAPEAPDLDRAFRLLYPSAAKSGFPRELLSEVPGRVYSGVYERFILAERHEHEGVTFPAGAELVFGGEGLLLAQSASQPFLFGEIRFQGGPGLEFDPETGTVSGILATPYESHGRTYPAGTRLFVNSTTAAILATSYRGMFLHPGDGEEIYSDRIETDGAGVMVTSREVQGGGVIPQNAESPDATVAYYVFGGRDDDDRHAGGFLVRTTDRRIVEQIHMAFVRHIQNGEDAAGAYQRLKQNPRWADLLSWR